MKKIWVMALALVLLALPAYANTPKIGVINFQVLQSTPQGQEAMNKVNGIQERLQQELAKRSQQLEDARKRNASETELQSMQQRFEQELAQLKEKGDQEYKATVSAFQDRVKSAIQKVAQDKKLDLVLSEQAVLHGGTDITEDVKKILAK